jgi:FtsZ-interacting cell division protein ZipA
MPELRWTLLIVGALFIAALALWELRRQRQAPRQNPPASGPHASTGGSTSASGVHPVSPSIVSGVEGLDDGVRVFREPTITFPELQPEASTELHLPVRREAAPNPPVVEVGAREFSDLRVEGITRDEPGPVDDPETVALEITQPKVVSAWSAEGKAAAAKAGEARAAEAKAAAEARDAEARAAAAQAAEATAPDRTSAPSSASVGYVRDDDAESESGEEHPAGATAAGAPIVDWPGEENRKIVALRLVSGPTARFLGRNVRMALAAEGFVLGKFDIFHKPGPDARALLSAASLTKPGTFALGTIDGQRFGGLSLFAVLPGPLPAQQTFDELLSTARNLNDRLQGALQDERGEPLTPMRSASIRESLTNGHGAPAASPPQAGSPQ